MGESEWVGEEKPKNWFGVSLAMSQENSSSFFSHPWSSTPPFPFHFLSFLSSFTFHSCDGNPILPGRISPSPPPSDDLTDQTHILEDWFLQAASLSLRCYGILPDPLILSFLHTHASLFALFCFLSSRVPISFWFRVYSTMIFHRLKMGRMILSERTNGIWV